MAFKVRTTGQGLAGMPREAGPGRLPAVSPVPMIAQFFGGVSKGDNGFIFLLKV